MNVVCSTAATKRENSRKDEGPTGTGAQYKQGNIVIIFVAVIIMMRTLCDYVAMVHRI